MKNKIIAWKYLFLIHGFIALHTNYSKSLYLQIRYDYPELFINKLLMLLSIMSYLFVVLTHIFPFFKSRILVMIRIGPKSFYYQIFLKMIICSLSYILVSILIDMFFVGGIQLGALLRDTIINFLIVFILIKINNKRDKDILIATICIYLCRAYMI